MPFGRKTGRQQIRSLRPNICTFLVKCFQLPVASHQGEFFIEKEVRMKKYIGALFLSMALSHAVLADTTIPWTKAGCESVKGKWITAHSATDSGCDAAHCNGKNFCRSTTTMNWWSALIWCKSIGHKLVSFDTLCPGIPSGPNKTQGSCANVTNIDADVWTWTSMPWNNDTILNVGLRSGAIDNTVRTSTGGQAACEE